MKLSISFLTIIAFSLFCSCKTSEQSEQVKLALDNVDLTDKKLAFKIKKGACFGTCPVYIMNIYEDRYAEFIGKQHVSKVGVFAQILSKEEYKNLESKFKASQFNSFEDYYESNIADLPTVELSYATDKGIKTIVGKRERPEELHKLQYLLEAIAESDEAWVKTSKVYNAPKEPKIDKTKIIVKLAKGNQLSKWFEKMKEKFGVQILRRLDNEYNEWLITYDTKDFSPDEIMSHLKVDPTLASAEFLKVQN